MSFDTKKVTKTTTQEFTKDGVLLSTVITIVEEYNERISEVKSGYVVTKENIF